MDKPNVPKKERASTQEVKRRTSLNLAMKEYAKIDSELQRMGTRARRLRRRMRELVAQIDRHTTAVPASTLASVVVKPARKKGVLPGPRTQAETRERKRTEERLKRRTTRYRETQQKMQAETGTPPESTVRKA